MGTKASSADVYYLEHALRQAGSMFPLVAHQDATAAGPTSRAGEEHTLTQGTLGWARFGTHPANPDGLADGADSAEVGR